MIALPTKSWCVITASVHRLGNSLVASSASPATTRAGSYGIGRCKAARCVRPLWTKTFCKIHAVAYREKVRKKQGCQPWRQGFRGRPPKLR
jgi:hypothetical protein